MAHSIELRAPYLDHRLFEYVLCLPRTFKVRRGATKPLLADALPKPLPAEIQRQTKRGFTFPVQEWLKDHLTQTFEQYVLLKENAIFWDLDVVSSIWRAYQNGTVGSEVVWNLYAFARWIKGRHESL